MVHRKIERVFHILSLSFFALCPLYFVFCSVSSVLCSPFFLLAVLCSLSLSQYTVTRSLKRLIRDPISRETKLTDLICFSLDFYNCTTFLLPVVWVQCNKRWSLWNSLRSLAILKICFPFESGPGMPNQGPWHWSLLQPGSASVPKTVSFRVSSRRWWEINAENYYP